MLTNLGGVFIEDPVSILREESRILIRGLVNIMVACFGYDMRIVGHCTNRSSHFGSGEDAQGQRKEK
jgi:hypothetical protein